MFFHLRFDRVTDTRLCSGCLTPVTIFFFFMTRVTLTLETELAALLRGAALADGGRSVSSVARKAFAAYFTRGAGSRAEGTGAAAAATTMTRMPSAAMSRAIANIAHAKPLEAGRAVPSPPRGVCGVEQATEPRQSRCPEYDRHSCLSRPSAATCPQTDGQECPSSTNTHEGRAAR